MLPIKEYARIALRFRKRTNRGYPVNMGYDWEAKRKGFLNSTEYKASLPLLNARRAGFRTAEEHAADIELQRVHARLLKAQAEGFKSVEEQENFLKRLSPQNGRPVTLGFDPKRLKGCVRVIWYRPVARTIWLGCRWRYLTNQFYNGAVMIAAREILAKRPKTVFALKQIISCFMSQHWGWQRVPDQLCEELLPFIVDAVEETIAPGQLHFPFYVKHRYSFLVQLKS